MPTYILIFCLLFSLSLQADEGAAPAIPQADTSTALELQNVEPSESATQSKDGAQQVDKNEASAAADKNAAANSAVHELHQAVHEHDIKTLKKLLQQDDVDAGTYRDQHGCSLLMCALEGPHQFQSFDEPVLGDILKILLEHNVPVNHSSPLGMGMSPLMVAVQANYMHGVKLLLDQGADPNTSDKLKRTVLIWSIHSGDNEITHMLLDNYDVDVNAFSIYGESALMEAAAGGYLDVAKKLVAKRADVNAQGYRGLTALMLAAVAGHLDVVQFLVHKGARLDITDEHDHNALEHAMAHDQHAVVKWLKQKMQASRLALWGEHKG